MKNLSTVKTTKAALGIWSGGHFMPFGADIGEERLIRLIRQAYEKGIRTFVTADVYAEGEADRLLGRALSTFPRDSYFLAGAVGHDFYQGKRGPNKAYPRFTDPSLRGPEAYASYLEMASRRSLERIGAEYFDLLFLHNPDSIGYTSEAVWKGLEKLKEKGLTHSLGLAPGPANGFVLDLIGAFEAFGSLIDWAMIILNPLESWPGSLVLPAAGKFDVKIMARVVDCGGLFHGTVRPGTIFLPGDHRSFRPTGWVEEAQGKIERLRKIADTYQMTLLELSYRWTLAQPSVACVIPTLIQEVEEGSKEIEEELEELTRLRLSKELPEEVVKEITRIGDNRNSIPLKGASPQYLGEVRADQWPLLENSIEVAKRWGIVPDRDMSCRKQNV